MNIMVALIADVGKEFHAKISA